MSAMSGISVNSGTASHPATVAHSVRTPVETMTNASPISVPRSRHARKP